MKDRIREVRARAGMTQEKFAEKLGLKRNTIATYEIGKSIPIDTVILSICREFNVREEWLRNGTGYMSVTLSQDDRFSINLGKLGRSENEFIVNAVNILAETEPEKLEIVEQLMKKLLGI